MVNILVLFYFKVPVHKGLSNFLRTRYIFHIYIIWSYKNIYIYIYIYIYVRVCVCVCVYIYCIYVYIYIYNYRNTEMFHFYSTI